jgi:xanthine dehydrogenase accessory factor
MNENEFLPKIICEQLETGSPLVLVSIMSLQGSTPRHSGTKMVVDAAGKGHGTIGGSLIEATAMREARQALASAKSKIISFELSGKDANAPGMICGGKAEILLDYLPVSEENRGFAARWYEAIRQSKDFFLLTHIKGTGNKVNVAGHAVLFTDGSFSPCSSLNPSDIEKLHPEMHNMSLSAVIPIGDSRVLVDRIRKVKTVCCFGAGHVAVPTAHLAAMAGFHVAVFDDRPEYANTERFLEANEVRVIDFKNAFDGLEIDSDTYIVILTRGHQFDREVLEQALKTRAGYIGMISSRRKKEAIYEALMAEGIKKEKLDKVHSPIGIAIGGETPEEIAVSIVAELISVRSRQVS